MTEKITPDAVLGSGSIALPVPGGIIRMTYGGGLSVEPAATPSVEHPHEGLTCAEVETELVRLNQAVPSVEQIEEVLAGYVAVANRTPVAKGIHALFADRAPEGSTVAALLDARRSRIAALETEVARLKEAQRADGEVMYANGDEITTLQARVQSLESEADAAHALNARLRAAVERYKALVAAQDEHAKRVANHHFAEAARAASLNALLGARAAVEAGAREEDS